MTSPSVSFIIPCYNEEVLLPGCLSCLAAQTSRDFEVIVVDNNCTDQTGEVAARFGANVVTCSEQGISAARNAGAKFSRGQLLAFLDADSAVGCDWLHNAQSALLRRQLDAVYGMNVFHGPTALRSAAYNAFNLLFSGTAIALNFFGRCMIAGNNLVIKKATLDAAGGWPPYVAEDVLLERPLRQARARVGFSRGMRAVYSARRFEKLGYLSTLLCWLRSVVRRTPESGYRLDYAQNSPGETASYRS